MAAQSLCVIVPVPLESQLHIMEALWYRELRTVEEEQMEHSAAFIVHVS